MISRSSDSTSDESVHGAPRPLTSLIGRERDVAEIRELLNTGRLVTLTGPGGSGKTRLAVSATRELSAMFANGVWWVELAALTDEDLILPAVARAFGVRERPDAQLVAAIEQRLAGLGVDRRTSTLLVLDNCEHLVEACAALVHELLARCPGLSVLATSREPLGVHGEQNWPVPPLSIPDPLNLPPITSLPRYEAVRLFVERAVAVDPGFALTQQNAMAVARVCHRLDGLPLAIELAAARTRMLDIESIAARLQRSFDLLTGGSRTVLPRQRTLRATIEWSEHLLTPQERGVWRRLSVFAGGFSLGAAESVCGDVDSTANTFDIITALVDKSLVQVVKRNGPARYRLLESVRDYGREMLVDSGEMAAVHLAHAQYFLRLADRAGPLINTGARGEVLRALMVDRDNFRAALEYSQRTGDHVGPYLAEALLYFWWFSGHTAEGRRWLDDAATRLSASGDDPGALARCLTGAGLLGCVQGDFTAARATLTEAVRISRTLDDPVQLATAIRFLSGAHEAQGDLPTGRALIEESLELLRQHGDKRGISLALSRLGITAAHQQDDATATAAIEESIALSREVQDNWALALALRHKAMHVLRLGDIATALAAAAESLALVRDQGDRYMSVQCAETLAVVRAAAGDHQRAAMLFGALERQREEMAVPVIYRRDYQGGTTRSRDALGEKAFGDAWERGRALSPDAAIDLALDEPADRRPPAQLSARETQVLTLVARGMTNNQVASQLYLSARTINWHLTSIYEKLGVTSRTEAARIALDLGLR